jgi:REP element-mobilizing transposase RayT
MDRLLDAAQAGPRFLSDPRIADMVVAALAYNASVLKRCQVHTFAVMPNHVHLLASLQFPLPEFMRSLKTFTAKTRKPDTRPNRPAILAGRKL